MPAMKVLVTGATGFVGKALCEELVARGHTVVPTERRASGLAGDAVVGNIDGVTDWTAALAACDAVVHLAARVHVVDDTAQDPLALYRATNTEATLNLARQAVQAGVKRFVFISTIKVNGEGRDAPYREIDVPAPEGAYAMSKWEAEQGLMRIAQQTGLEVVILRPPLVYGPGVKGNFLRLLQLIFRSLPLPLASVSNLRSMIYLGNFLDALALCVDHPAAPGKTYLVSDSEETSTPQLIRNIARLMGRPCRLWPFPPALLKLVGQITGKSTEVERLIGSLQIDSSQIRRELDWTPPYTLDQGLAETVSWYLAARRA